MSLMIDGQVLRYINRQNQCVGELREKYNLAKKSLVMSVQDRKMLQQKCLPLNVVWDDVA